MPHVGWKSKIKKKRWKSQITKAISLQPTTCDVPLISNLNSQLSTLNISTFNSQCSQCSQLSNAGCRRAFKIRNDATRISHFMTHDSIFNIQYSMQHCTTSELRPATVNILHLLLSYCLLIAILNSVFWHSAFSAHWLVSGHCDIAALQGAMVQSVQCCDLRPCNVQRAAVPQRTTQQVTMQCNCN